jgi:hypothetical protein
MWGRQSCRQAGFRAGFSSMHLLSRAIFRQILTAAVLVTFVIFAEESRAASWERLLAR